VAVIGAWDLSNAPFQAELLRVTDPRSGARLCESQHAESNRRVGFVEDGSKVEDRIWWLEVESSQIEDWKLKIEPERCRAAHH
jgi:hypothetical protein